jgi:hypothetical protein
LTEAEKFIQRLAQLAYDCVETAKKKNADYANSDDPFANFKTAPLSKVSVERGLLVRMADKFLRISNLIDRPAAVKGESIADSLSDLANYALILRIWIEEKERRGDA